MGDGLWAVALLFTGGGVMAVVLLATRPPKCRPCGVRATEVEEYELSACPRVLAVAYRCPSCGALIARRTLDVPVE